MAIKKFPINTIMYKNIDSTENTNSLISLINVYDNVGKSLVSRPGLKPFVTLQGWKLL